MRKFRTPAAIAIAVGLLGGSTIGVAAQDAETDPLVAAWVTGTIALASSCSGPNSTSEADVVRDRDYVCEPQTWTASDARLSGTATSKWNADVYNVDGATISVSAGMYEVRNESGGWLCRYADGLSHGSGLFATADNDETLTCAGDGAYEGLTAILVLDWTNSPPSNVPLAGLIFPGDVPPLPELSAAE